jgi:hypothetical protein
MTVTLSLRMPGLAQIRVTIGLLPKGQLGLPMGVAFRIGGGNLTINWWSPVKVDLRSHKQTRLLLYS